MNEPFLGELRWYSDWEFVGTRKDPAYARAAPVLQQWNGSFWQEVPEFTERHP